MPRPKGSKNKPKTVKTAQVDFAVSITEKEEVKKQIEAEIATLYSIIEDSKKQLKEKKTALKATERQIALLETKKAKEDQKVVEETQKAKLAGVVRRLMKSGLSIEKILEKLK